MPTEGTKKRELERITLAAVGANFLAVIGAFVWTDLLSVRISTAIGLAVFLMAFVVLQTANGPTWLFGFFLLALAACLIICIASFVVGITWLPAFQTVGLITLVYTLIFAVLTVKTTKPQ